MERISRELIRKETLERAELDKLLVPAEFEKIGEPEKATTEIPVG